MNRRCEVLLAVYNGERFLADQISSIMGQTAVEVRVLASDDGSRDGSADVLKGFAQRLSDRFQIVPTVAPAGSAKGNFLRLMEAATGEYVCFADQDDVWVEDKVRRSMEMMRELEGRHGRDVPLLVFSDLRVVDEGLKTVAESYWRAMEIEPESVHRLARLVGRSVVTGCTMTINGRMLELARRMPEEATMHDRWIGLLAAAMGATGIVREQTVLYRQHGANVVGAVVPDGSVTGVAGRAADGTGRRAERRRSELQVEALLRVHRDEMPARSVEVLEAYLKSGRSASAVERVWLTLRYGFFRGGLLKTLGTLMDLARARSDAP